MKKEPHILWGHHQVPPLPSPAHCAHYFNTVSSVAAGVSATSTATTSIQETSPGEASADVPNLLLEL